MSFSKWDKLLYGIERGECILFLGPDLPLVTDEGEKRPPIAELASLLDPEPEEDGNREPEAADLPQIAQAFLAREDEVGLELAVARWFEGLKGTRSLLHEELAGLPFRITVTSSHDPLMEGALRRHGKKPSVERYHYRGRNPELLAIASEAEPILYHLYGHPAEPASVVLTESQLLDFLTSLISKDPPLPNDLNAALANGRIFLFLGFGLENWYLRMLLHVLKVLRRDSRAFAVETARPRGAGGDGAVIFYRQNFKMDVEFTDIVEFCRELYGRYRKWAAVNAPPTLRSGEAAAGMRPEPKQKVFICHATENSAQAREVFEALSAAGLEPWLDQENLRGGDRWDSLIEATIQEVDFVVVLNSRALLAKGAHRHGSYVIKEINVALRAMDYRLAEFIIPAKIDDAPLLDPLLKLQAEDLSKPDGMKKLVRAIKRRVAV